MDEPKSIPMVRERLERLAAWMTNPEYKAYLKGVEQDILACKENIVRTPPVTPEATARCLMLHGKLDVLNDNFQLFENARVDLEHQLSTLLDEATKIAPNIEEE